MGYTWVSFLPLLLGERTEPSLHPTGSQPGPQPWKRRTADSRHKAGILGSVGSAGPLSHPREHRSCPARDLQGPGCILMEPRLWKRRAPGELINNARA